MEIKAQHGRGRRRMGEWRPEVILNQWSGMASVRREHQNPDQADRGSRRKQVQRWERAGVSRGQCG